LTINITGKVIHGDHFGRKLGFPTANIDRRNYQRRKLNIKFGVYGGEVQIEIRNMKYEIWPAAIVVGPVDKQGLPKLEAHLIGFKGELYGKKLIFTLQKFIRPFKKYKDVEELKKQITDDIKEIKKL
jgi:riboflavin kinase / FMN adenylyltransferase